MIYIYDFDWIVCIEFTLIWRFWYGIWYNVILYFIKKQKFKPSLVWSLKLYNLFIHADFNIKILMNWVLLFHNFYLCDSALLTHT